MQSKFLSASALVLLSSSFAAAQTYSACNPVKGDKCPADPAFGTTVEIDFTKGASSYFTEADGTTIKYDGSKGAAFTMKSETDAPTISSTKYLFFGSVEVVCQVAPGVGVVSSFVLQSDDLDEIDWEWLGGDTTQAQTNYFSKGDTTTYNRGGFSPVSNPQTSFHTYTVDWSTDAVVWSIDGTVVRTLTAADATAANAALPQTPMQVKLGTWDGGSSTAAKGTVEWAGGLTPWDNGETYTAYYKSVKIVDKSNGVSGAKSYSYGDSSGTYESIKISTTDSGESSSNSTSSSSESASASATTSTAKTSTTATAKTTDTKTDSKTTAKAVDTASESATASTTTTANADAKSTVSSTAAAATTLSTATGTGSGSSSAATSGSNGTLATGSGTPTPTSSGAAATGSAVTTSGAGKLTAGLIGAVGAAMAAFMTL